MKKIIVIIEVRGGVAECANEDQLPKNIEVVIIDWDNIDDEEDHHE